MFTDQIVVHSAVYGAGNIKCLDIFCQSCKTQWPESKCKLFQFIEDFRRRAKFKILWKSDNTYYVRNKRVR